MSQWKNDDSAANSVLWAVSQYNSVANSTTQAAFFGNTTANAYIAGVTVGQYGVDTNETAATPAVTHAGWVVKTEGQGGRAGRVTYETLVAMGSMTGDAEDSAFPDYALSITTHPSDASANSTDNEQATFTVVAASVPTGASLSYLWQYTTDPGNTETWATTAAVSGFADQTTATLTADANTISDGTLVRVVVSATGAANVTSNAAELTVTS